MREILIPSQGPEDWRRVLAEPDKHWRRRYSAKALAYCWESARDFPPSVRRVFSASPFTVFHKIEMLIGIVEHRVPLPGRGYPSQTDLFVLAKSEGDLVSIAVEGKVSEPFDDLVSDWLARPARAKASDGDVPLEAPQPSTPSPAKLTRLAGLCRMLELDEEDVKSVRYQLVHRTAAALIEAERFNARHALMLVHSFNQKEPPDSFDDYECFAALLRTKVEKDAIAHVGKRDGVELYLGWVIGEAEFLSV